MTGEYRSFKAAAVQASPVLPMNRKATVDKACTLIEEAGKNGAQLVVFPETFVPMYPNWSIDLQNPAEWARLPADKGSHRDSWPGDRTVGKGGKKSRRLPLYGRKRKGEEV